MKYAPKPFKENGLTLIETLIALLIIGFAIVAFMVTHTHSHRTVGATQRHSVAIHLVQQQLEALKRMDGSANNRNTPAWSAIFANPPITNNVNGIRYNTTTALIPAAELPASIQANVNLIPIRVTVNWNEPTVAGPVPKSISIDNFYYP